MVMLTKPKADKHTSGWVALGTQIDHPPYSSLDHSGRQTRDRHRFDRVGSRLDSNHLGTLLKLAIR